MPRKARIDAPDALHHIICRGIERSRIFRDNTDCEDFNLERTPQTMNMPGAGSGMSLVIRKDLYEKVNRKEEIMKKFEMFSVVAVIFLLAIPMVTYAETGQECASNCSSQCNPLGSGPDWASCMENCLKGCMDKDTGVPDVPPPTPVNPSQSKTYINSSETSAVAVTGKESVLTNIVVASAFDDLDQPCYVGGKYVGNCSRNKPYYNAFSGECYATLQDCKKADGDLGSAPGPGGCVRCGK